MKLTSTKKILDTAFDTKAYLKYISSEEYLEDKRREVLEQIAAYLENSHEGITVTYEKETNNFSFGGDIEQIGKAIEVLNEIREE